MQKEKPTKKRDAAEKQPKFGCAKQIFLTTNTVGREAW